MKYTTNYNLKKPDGNEFVKREDLNENADIIDTELKAVDDKITSHSADLASQEAGKGADIIGLPDPNYLFTATNVGGAMQELFTNVSNGKSLVGGAIADVDPNVVVPTDPTFQDLATAIGLLGGGIESIQHGQYTIPTNDAITDVTISTVDVNRSIIIANNTGWQKRGDRGFFRAEILNGDTVRFSRELNGGTPLISYTVIEFKDAVVQKGTVTHNFTSTTFNKSVPISEIDLSKTLLFATFSSSVQAAPDFPMASGFNNNNEIFFMFSAGASQECNIHWQVVEIK